MPSDDVASLDLREQIARIDRARAESDKFVAEQRKLISDAAKYERERWWQPILATAAATVALIGIATFILKLISG